MPTEPPTQGGLSGNPLYYGLAAVLWCASGLLIVLLFARTIAAMAGREICVEDLGSLPGQAIIT